MLLYYNFKSIYVPGLTIFALLSYTSIIAERRPLGKGRCGLTYDSKKIFSLSFVSGEYVTVKYLAQFLNLVSCSHNTLGLHTINLQNARKIKKALANLPLII